MKIAVIGSNGLIGSRFDNLLKNDYDIFGIDRTSGIDIKNKEQLFKVLDDLKPSVIIHFAAKTNVDGCELDKEKDLDKLSKLEILKDGIIEYKKINYLDWKDDEESFAINVVGTKNLVDYSAENRIKFIYLSTDFIFDGEKGNYIESDLPSPANWYGQTKYWGEKIVTENLDNYFIARLSYPYGYRSEIKKDFVWRIIEVMNSQKEISLIEDHIFTPTFIDDIILALEFLIKRDLNGIYHVTGNNFLSPYEAGRVVNKNFFNNEINILKVKREDYYKGRAKRGFNLSMKNDKLVKLGFRMKSFDEGLNLVLKSI